MPLFTHTLATPRDREFLAQSGCDPVTKEPLKAGDVVVICAGPCGSAFLYDSWRNMNGQHCGQSSTLATLPPPFRARIGPSRGPGAAGRHAPRAAAGGWRRPVAVMAVIIAVGLAVWWAGPLRAPDVRVQPSPVDAVDKKTPPYRGALEPGMQVRRGRDWKWGDQDGGTGRLGTVTVPDSQNRGWWWVKWDSGGKNRYRWGGAGAYDLDVVGRSAGPARSEPRVADARRLTADDALTLKGIGPLRIGMTTGEAASALGRPLIGDTSASCAMLKPQDAPEGLMVMAVRGRIATVAARLSSARARDRQNIGRDKGPV